MVSTKTIAVPIAELVGFTEFAGTQPPNERLSYQWHRPSVAFGMSVGRRADGLWPMKDALQSICALG